MTEANTAQLREQIAAIRAEHEAHNYRVTALRSPHDCDGCVTDGTAKWDVTWSNEGRDEEPFLCDDCLAREFREIRLCDEIDRLRADLGIARELVAHWQRLYLEADRERVELSARTGGGVQPAPAAEIPVPPLHPDDEFPLIIPGTQLTTLQIYQLDAACAPLWSAFVGSTYLVGSALASSKHRDVDVRTMLDDGEFDRLFGGAPKLWDLVCSSIGQRLTAATGLPIDYQIQRTTEANAKYDGPRNPIGTGRVYAGGGDATNFEPSAAGSTDGAGTPGEVCKIWHGLYGACELPYLHDGPHARVPGGASEANRWWGTTCECDACRPERAKLAAVCEFDFDGCPGDCPGEIHQRSAASTPRSQDTHDWWGLVNPAGERGVCLVGMVIPDDDGTSDPCGHRSDHPVHTPGAGRCAGVGCPCGAPDCLHSPDSTECIDAP